MNVSENITLGNLVQENISLGAGNANVTTSLSPPPNYGFANGTGAGNIDIHWELANATAVTLAPAASVTYTYSALTDGIGRTVAFARLRKHIIQITAKTGDDFLTVGGASTHAATCFGTGSFYVFDLDVKVAANTAGFVIGSGATDQVKITNSGSADITFAILLSGDTV